MILTDYKLREFKATFNAQIREDVDDKTKFKIFKMELLQWLKSYDVDLHVFPDLKIEVEGYSLVMSYTETTDTTMTIRFMWRVSRMTIVEVLDFCSQFCLELGVKEPTINVTDQFTYNNLGLYYPQDKTLVISEHIIFQFKPETVIAILKHELLHHYCNVKKLGARDVDYDFIELLIKYDAYISKAPEANLAYETFVANLMKHNDGRYGEVFSDAKRETLVRRWLAKRKLHSNAFRISNSSTYTLGA